MALFRQFKANEFGWEKRAKEIYTNPNVIIGEWEYHFTSDIIERIHVIMLLLCVVQVIVCTL